MAFGKKTRTGSEGAEESAPWEGPTWTYATVTAQTNSDTLLNRLNEMGQQGWEAVGMTVASTMSQVLLKRAADD